MEILAAMSSASHWQAAGATALGGLIASGVNLQPVLAQTKDSGSRGEGDSERLPLLLGWLRDPGPFGRRPDSEH